MDVTDIYAIAAGGLYGIILFVNFVTRSISFLRTYLSVIILRHVIYPFFLRRHRVLGPWTRSSVLLHTFYWAGTIFCGSFGASNFATAAARAGILSLINMIPLYSGFHLSFVADMLGISLKSYRHLHGSIGRMIGALTIFHVVVNVAQDVQFSSQTPTKLWGLIVNDP